MPDEPFIPDFPGIVESAVWKEQIAPWLDSMYRDSLEFRAGVGRGPAGDGTQPSTIEDLNYWCGWCGALNAILNTPRERMEMDRQRAAEEKKDAYLEVQRRGRQRGRAAGF